MTPKNPAAPYYADAAPDDQPAAASPTISWPAATATLQAAALASCIRICWIARRGRAPHGGANGPLLRPDQVPTRQILRGCEQARRRQARIRDLFDRRRLRPAGEVLRRREDRHRPFREREGADDPGHSRYAHHHHIQGILTSLYRAAQVIVAGKGLRDFLDIVAGSCSSSAPPTLYAPPPLGGPRAPRSARRALRMLRPLDRRQRFEVGGDGAAIFGRDLPNVPTHPRHAPADRLP